MVQGGKSLVCEEKSKTITFFTKAKDIKNYIFVKPLRNSRRNMRHTLIFVEKKTFYFFNFLGIFFHPP